MQLVTYRKNSREHIGAQLPDTNEIIKFLDSEVPYEDMLRFIQAGDEALALAQQIIARGENKISLDDVELLAPIPRPLRNVFCVGKNYRAHLQEVSLLTGSTQNKENTIPEEPIFFTKATQSVIGPDAPIPSYLDVTNSVDYEGELAVIIGKAGRGISRENAMQHVFGFTILNDVTSRRLQKKHQQWFLGKSLDGFCPMGPAILTVDSVADVAQLSITTRVNEIRQQGSLSDLIFDIPTLIYTLSQYMTLLPGDVIATGTPAGVGMGFKPPKYLKAGDIVSISINGIGELENPVE